MTASSSGPDVRDAATFILPGVVGIGVGAFVASLVFDSTAMLVLVGGSGALAGHAAGYLLLRERSDRFA